MTTSETGEDTKEWGSAKVVIHQLFLPTLSVSSLIWRWPSLRITATAGTRKCPDYQWDLISGNREGSRPCQLRICQQRETYKESLKKQRWVDWNERRLRGYRPFFGSRFFCQAVMNSPVLTFQRLFLYISYGVHSSSRLFCPSTPSLPNLSSLTNYLWNLTQKRSWFLSNSSHLKVFHLWMSV